MLVEKLQEKTEMVAELEGRLWLQRQNLMRKRHRVRSLKDELSEKALDHELFLKKIKKKFDPR